MSSIKELLIKNLKAQEKDMNSHFKEVATSAGWEPHLTEAVSFTQGTIKISEKFKSEVEDAEYGSMASPPNAAMRKFNPEHKKYVEQAITKAIKEYIDQKFNGGR